MKSISSVLTGLASFCAALASTSAHTAVSPASLLPRELRAKSSSLAAKTTGKSTPLRPLRVRVISDFRKDGLLKVRGMDLVLSVSRGTNRSPNGVGDSKVRLERAPLRSEWSIACKTSGLELTSVNVAQQGKPATQSSQITVSSDIEFETPAGFLSVSGVPYRNKIIVTKKCEAINEVDVDDYLDGLVNAEFSSKWSKEAVSAQVIAARTYALYQMMEASRKGRAYDVESTIKDQVYPGVKGEDSLASRIVDETRGWVLLAERGHQSFEPLKAFYHSTCGGQTELPHAVWGMGQPGFYRTVSCPFCLTSPRIGWSEELTHAEVLSVLYRAYHQSRIQISQLIDVKVDISDALRVKKLDFTLTDGRSPNFYHLSLSGQRLRELAGSDRIRSTRFELTVDVKAQKLKFHGRGFGHGVGMCQWGAKTMGEKGMSRSAILSHYYPDAKLKKLW